MAEHMHLIGAEDVRSAGSAMRSAAEDMRSAAFSIDSALDRHQRFLDDWLQRLEAALERAAPPSKTDTRTEAERDYDMDRYSAR
ncbi:hypothetical protein EN742_00800 [Mesorhizobium sp. M4A.F.Ca.ET.020.02.1.1]|uniref:hypothetical protein n=1 Tax=Mesorhizobium sp. M4A.F.Ca.ET.020.02.1.1 TaxID=2496652 RepID=UPI000FD2A010|nr:hypothetical protein [Mesorhizobium sp. M4A.F.Ca.ET.020.02.1.1]RVD44916.1 hypothetical protein EN742_00800 [Mesorhizobium sp. M4A.F.Ca.ET.020.02.1.1]